MKRHPLILLVLFFLSHSVAAAESWIRINQLGYLPESNKKALMISESDAKVTSFTLYDALTNEAIITLNTVQSFGVFEKFNSNYELDFSTFRNEGAFYIKVGTTYSPTIYINHKLYVTAKEPLTKLLLRDHNKHSFADPSVQATTAYTLLFSYQQHPKVHADQWDTHGEQAPNGIPDIIDAAKIRLDALLGRNYSSAPPALAGKVVAAFALGTEVMGSYYPTYVDSLRQKAIALYQATIHDITNGMLKGSTTGVNAANAESWKDDLQLAATQLYFLTYESAYLKDAIHFGAAEPVPPWLFTQCDAPMEFYPFINWAPFQLLQVENPQIKKTYLHTMLVTLQRAQLIARDNPFHIGIHLSQQSNSKMIALHNLCHRYRTITADTTFMQMEEALNDWIFGRNPWGISMVVDFPTFGISPQHPHAASFIDEGVLPTGGLINGAMSSTCLEAIANDIFISDPTYERFQTNWATYHDDINDTHTNQLVMDGTAALLQAMASRQSNGKQQGIFDHNHYYRGGIERFNPEKKQIALIFTGHAYTDGYRRITKALDKTKVPAAFFFSGDFLRSAKNKSIVKKLIKKGHYIGPATNHYKPLAKWEDLDFIQLHKTSFQQDLKENYKALKKAGISKQQAPFFFPPFELYNDSISRWCKEVGITLIRSTPGTNSNLDYTFPEMRENYYSTKEILDQITRIEISEGLNGYILQFNFRTNPGRKDKFYNALAGLIGNLQKKGYRFVDLYTAVE